MSASPRRRKEVRRPRRVSLRRVQLIRNPASPNAPTGGRPDRDDRDRSVRVLLVLLAAGIGIGVLHNRWRALGRPDPVLAIARILTFPVQAGGSYAEAGIFGGWGTFFESRKLAADNARLQSEVDSLKTENESLRQKAADDDRLRAAASFLAKQAKPPLAANVIGLLPTPHIDTITIDRGTHDGVRVQTIARTPDGLVGQVVDAGPISSEVLLLSDTGSEVGALVQRNGKLQGIGILQGGGRGQPLKLIDVTREADVRPGDQVVSSGYGGVFPPDVPIGTIASVRSEDAQFLKSAVVAPAAGMPGDLRAVYLLRP